MNNSDLTKIKAQNGLYKPLEILYDFISQSSVVSLFLSMVIKANDR
jgi:hypothetical protein